VEQKQHIFDDRLLQLALSRRLKMALSIREAAPLAV
jgi:hypothetical protein